MQHLPKLREQMFLLLQLQPQQRQLFASAQASLSNFFDDVRPKLRRRRSNIRRRRNRVRTQIAAGFLQQQSRLLTLARLQSAPPDRPNPRANDFRLGGEGNAVFDCFVVTCGGHLVGRFDFRCRRSTSSSSADTACFGSSPARLRLLRVRLQTSIAHRDHCLRGVQNHFGFVQTQVEKLDQIVN